MNYYPHHIGDFNSATRHLTRIERSIYRDMIEMYYDTEQALPLDRAALCRKLMARSDEESTAVEQVLNEFFTETEQGWTNGRCDKEIEAYHKKLNGKSAAGKASAAARAANKAPLEPAPDKESSTGLQQPLKSCSTNQEPRTKNQNQEPKETTPPPAAKPSATKKSKIPLPDGFAVSERVIAWADEKGHGNLQAHLENFVSAAKRNGYVYADWDEALMEAIRKDWAKLSQAKGLPTDLDSINARNNAEAKRLLFGTPSDLRTINA